MNEQELEAELVAKGKTAVRLTPDLIDATIRTEAHWVVPGTTTTVYALTLRNGFTVIGHSACASPANFDPVIGCRLARERARAQIWELEGYLLCERLATT